jgi:hypothetical protein
MPTKIERRNTMTAYFETSNGTTKIEGVARIDRCESFFGIRGYEIRYQDGTFSLADETVYTLVSIKA